MNNDFLQDLALSVEDRAKLKQLAAPTPMALLEMIHASPASFVQFIGADKVDGLIQQLEAMIAADSMKFANASNQWRPGMGAIVDRQAPLLKQPGFNVEVRDQLFAELQALRLKNSRSPQETDRIQQLEQQLNTLLEAAR